MEIVDFWIEHPGGWNHMPILTVGKSHGGSLIQDIELALSAALDIPSIAATTVHEQIFFFSEAYNLSKNSLLIFVDFHVFGNYWNSLLLLRFIIEFLYRCHKHSFHNSFQNKN